VPADFLAHRRVIVDNLNTHCSESLMRWMDAVAGPAIDLGEKGKRDILARKLLKRR
jgi:hypothetical protein